MNDLLCICNSNNSNDNLFYLLLGAGITFIGSLFVAILIFYLTFEKDKRKKILGIKNNIVYVCDKLITYAINAEQCQAAFRFHELRYQRSKSAQDEYEYRKFHELALEAVFKLQLQKSEMIKYLHELFIYDKETANKISEFYNEATKYVLRDFIFQQIDETNYSEIINGTKDHILYKGIGIHLREIMKILELNIIKIENNIDSK